MNLKELIEPYITPAFEAGFQAGLKALGRVEKYIDPAQHPRDGHGHFLKIASGKSDWLPPATAAPTAAPSSAASQPTEPGIPLKGDTDPMAAILGAMLLHAVECAEANEDMMPGLQALVGLVRDRAKLAKITGLPQATVQKAYWAMVEKAWNESAHPRGRNGRFIGIGRIEDAKLDPAKAAQLRKEVKPEDKQKLEDALGGVHADMPKTKKGSVKLQAHERRTVRLTSRKRADELLGKFIKAGELKGSISPEELHELPDLLQHLRVHELRQLRKAMIGGLAKRIGWEGARKHDAMVQRLAGFAQLHAHNMRLEEAHGGAKTLGHESLDAPHHAGQGDHPEREQSLEEASSGAGDDFRFGGGVRAGHRDPHSKPTGGRFDHDPVPTSRDAVSGSVDPKGNKAGADLPKPPMKVNKPADDHAYEPFPEKAGHLIDPGELKSRAPADHMLDATVSAIHRVAPDFHADGLHHGSMSDRLNALAEFDKHAKSLLGGADTKSVRNLDGFESIADGFDATVKELETRRKSEGKKFDPEEFVEDFSHGEDMHADAMAEALRASGHVELAHVYSKHARRIHEAATEALRDMAGPAPKPDDPHEMSKSDYDDDMPWDRHKDATGKSEFTKDEAAKHVEAMTSPDREAKAEKVYGPGGSKATGKFSVHHRPTHESVVRDALATGKDVPDDVLDDHPHLRKKEAEEGEKAEPYPWEKATPPTPAELPPQAAESPPIAPPIPPTPEPKTPMEKRSAKVKAAKGKKEVSADMHADVIRYAKELRDGTHSIQTVNSLREHLSPLSIEQIGDVGKAMGYTVLPKTKKGAIDTLVQNIEGIQMSRQRMHQITTGQSSKSEDAAPTAPKAEPVVASPDAGGINKFGTAGEHHPLGQSRDEQLKNLGEAIRRSDQTGSLDPLGLRVGGLPAGLDVNKFAVAARNAADKHTADKSVGIRFDTLYDAVGKEFGLSKHDFQKAMAKLEDDGVLRLSGWSGVKNEIPDPGVATMTSMKVMYYAHPGKKSAPEPVAASPEAEPAIASSLKGKLASALSGIDPEHVRAQKADRQATYDKLTQAVEGAQKHRDELEAKRRTIGSKQPERRKLNKDIVDAEKLIRERQAKRDDYLDNNSHRENDLTHAAIDESHPEFVRYAAIRRKNEYMNPDETFEHIKGDVRDHLAKHGHDPELADAVAAEVAHNPLRAANGKLDKVIAEEKIRKQMQTERSEAKKHVESLGLEGYNKDEALRQANSLYAGDIGNFKTKWSGHAAADKTERERKAAIEREAKKRHEKDQASQKQATDYINAVKYPGDKGLPDADPDALRKVARHAMNAPMEWHAGGELPNAGNAKQIVDKIAKDMPPGRFAFPKAITESGWATDSKYMVKATPEMVAHAQAKGFDKLEGRTPPVKDIIDRVVKDGGTPAKMVANRTGEQGDSRVLFQTEDGKKAEMDAQYVANIKKFYPDSEAFVSSGAKPVLFKSKGEVVGLVMPLHSGGDAEEDKHTVNKGSPLELSHVLEQGPYSPDDMEDKGGTIYAGKGDKTMQVKIGGSSGAYTIPDHSDRTYATYAQAAKAAKELLSHAHGMDSEGLIFKPKGEKTELDGDEKDRVAFFKKLREHAKSVKGKAKKMKFGEGDDAEEREVHPVTEHFGVSKAKPDDKGKPGKGWDVLHTPTGLKTSGWVNKDDAVGHAILTQHLPGVDWGGFTAEDKDENPEQHERLKEIGKRMKGVTDAYENEQLHPDMKLPDK